MTTLKTSSSPVRHTFGGVVFEETGEVRGPKVGEWYLTPMDDSPIFSLWENCNISRKILRPAGLHGGDLVEALRETARWALDLHKRMVRWSHSEDHHKAPGEAGAKDAAQAAPHPANATTAHVGPQGPGVEGLRRMVQDEVRRAMVEWVNDQHRPRERDPEES